MKRPKASAGLIREFIGLPCVALVGVSSNPKKFGATAYQELKKRGWNVIPVNPALENVGGDPCYPDIKSIPHPVKGVISMVTKSQTLSIAKQTNELTIEYLWVQQMSDTPEVVNYCLEKEMKVIFGQCILMYYPPVSSIHAFHRWFNQLFGIGPKI